MNSLSFTAVFQVSLTNDVKFTVSSACQGNEVKFLSADLRSFVNGMASSRGVTFRMQELEMLIEEKPKILSGKPFFYLKNNDRSVHLAPHRLEADQINIVVKSGERRRFVVLQKEDLGQFLGLAEVAVFVMKNYGKRVGETMGLISYCLTLDLILCSGARSEADFLAENSADFQFKLARMGKALGIPNSLLFPLSRVIEAGIPKADSVSPSQRRVVSLLGCNEIINY